jgi:hypothetical protein
MMREVELDEPWEQLPCRKDQSGVKVGGGNVALLEEACMGVDLMVVDLLHRPWVDLQCV